MEETERKILIKKYNLEISWTENASCFMVNGKFEELESLKSFYMKKGDKVKLVGNFPKELYGTIIRKGHKNYWVVNIDGINTEFNEKRLEVVEEK